MPQGWPRGEARAVFVAVYDELAETAQEHVRAVVSQYASGSQSGVRGHTVAELGDLASRPGHAGPA
jgi:phenylacetic acid degradation operon negative regulatory protein